MTLTPDHIGLFRQALAAEAVKATTTRSLRWSFLAGTLITPVMAVFVGLTGSLQPDDTVLGGSLTGAPAAQIVTATFGAIVVSGEHSTGTVRPTFTAMPRRGTVLGAKALLVGGVTFLAGTLSAAVALALGGALLRDESHATGEPFPALLGVGLALAAAAVLGVALGAVLRHSAGAVAAVAGIALVPQLLAPLFGDLQRWVAGGSPASALEKMTQTSDATAETVGSLGPWPSLVVVAAYSGLALAGAGVLLRTRDV